MAGNARENFAQSASQVGVAVSRPVLDRLRALTEESLSQHHALIEDRADRGVPRDTHGDLRLDHVYLLPERPPPSDVVVIDCIEFNERFRFADPVADIAFLMMELKFHQHDELARGFADAYFRAAGDGEGRTLLPFYTSYRAAVRGKVEGLKATEPEVPEAERRLALTTARGHWLLSLRELERPSKRPALVLMGGLPGTGKSTLASELGQRAGFRVIRSDVVRKALAGAPGNANVSSNFEQGIYTPEWTRRTYAECLRQVEQLLFEGSRVIVDASFREDAQRQALLETAARWCVPAIFLLCQADPDAVRQRLAKRRGDVSDADWAIYLRTAETWQQPGALARGPADDRRRRRVDPSDRSGPVGTPRSKTVRLAVSDVAAPTACPAVFSVFWPGICNLMDSPYRTTTIPLVGACHAAEVVSAGPDWARLRRTKSLPDAYHGKI